MYFFLSYFYFTFQFIFPKYFLRRILLPILCQTFQRAYIIHRSHCEREIFYKNIISFIPSDSFSQRFIDGFSSDSEDDAVWFGSRSWKRFSFYSFLFSSPFHLDFIIFIIFFFFFHPENGNVLRVLFSVFYRGHKNKA